MRKETMNGKESAAYLRIPYESFRQLVRRGKHHQPWGLKVKRRLDKPHASHRRGWEYSFTRAELDDYCKREPKIVQSLRDRTALDHRRLTRKKRGAA